MAMNIQRKHFFLVEALADSETLAEVAQKLHMTPSALSHQLGELEKRIGLSIVNRKAKPLRLSAAGLRLLDSARDIVPRYEKLEQDLSRILSGDGGRLNMAIECHACYSWILPTLDQFRIQCPAVDLDISSGFSFDALKGLIEGDLDCVITADPESISGISYIPLFQYESVLLMPKDHVLVDEKVIQPAMLKNVTLITYPVSQSKLDIFRLFLNAENVEPAHIRKVELTTMMVALVASGRGVCALPNWAASEHIRHNYVVARSLGEGVFNTLHAAVREESLHANYMQEFLLLAKDMPFSTLNEIVRPA